MVADATGRTPEPLHAGAGSARLGRRHDRRDVGTSTNTTRDDRCPNCGGPLPPPDDNGVSVCAFCKNASRTPTDDVDPVIHIEFSDTVSTRPRRRVGGLLALVIIFVIAIGAVPLLLVTRSTDMLRDAFDSLGASSGSDIQGSGTAVILPGEPSEPVNLVAVVRSSSSRSRFRLVRFEPSKKDPIWRSGEFTAQSASIPVAVDAGTIAVAHGSDLVVFDSRDGREIWTRSISDSVQNACDTCLSIVGGQVVVSTIDGEIAAFDAATGTPTWTRTLTDTSPQVFVAGGMVGVIDSAERSVAVIDPPSGEVLDQFTPVCRSEDMMGESGIGGDAIVLTTPGDPGVYLGFGIMPGCWQRWDPTTHTVTWNVILEHGYLDSGAHGFIAGGTLWFTTRDRAILGGIDLVEGHFTGLPQLPDTESIPIALHGQTLILRGNSTRGTTRYLLWGLDVPSGNQPWQYLLDRAEPADPPDATTIFVSDDDKRFSAHLSGDVLHIVVFDGASRTIVISDLNPDTGAVSPPVVLTNTTRDLLPEFIPIAWRESMLVLRLGNSIAQLDAYDGTLDGH